MSKSASEAAIREVVARLQAGFESKSGDVFASAFAPRHDYVIVNGTLIPDLTREANAHAHQEMFAGNQLGARGGDLSKIDARFEVQNIRFLTPEIAVVHIIARSSSNEDTIATAVFQELAGEWLIVAYHNAFIHADDETAGAP